MPRIKKISLIYLPILLVLFYLFSEGAHAQQAPPKKNVLVLHGLWRIRTWEIPFNSSLHNEFLADKAVTAGITHVYLGLEDFPDGVHPQELIEELRDRVEKNSVDLVISVLPGADRFLLSYGQALFPGIPKVFAFPGTREIQKLKKLNNAVIIPSAAEKTMQTNVERIYSLLPDTRHLVVVCGNSSLDHNYLEMAKRAIASSKRVTKVSYLVGLPLEELWRRVSRLAADTAIFFTTYAEDINGKKETALDVALRLSANANAPVFSFHEVLLGTGMIGGSVTSSESYGKDTAKAALMLLKGEPPATISPNEQISFDVYDWRALKRWSISEKNLPPGSIVRFKEFSIWDRYKGRIIGAVALVVLQALIISFLLHQRRIRRRAESQLRERLTFEQTLFELSSEFLNLSADSVDLKIQEALSWTGTFMNADRCFLFRFSWDKTEFRITHLWEAEEIPKDESVRGAMVKELFPWLSENLLSGKDIIISDVQELLTEEARNEYEYCRQIGIQSFLLLPIQVKNAPLCAIGLDSIRIKRKWSTEVKDRLRLVGEVFATTIARKQSEEKLKAAELRYRTVADFTYDWEYWANIDGSLEYVSPSCERISGYTPQDFINNPGFFREIIVPEDREIWDAHDRDSQKELKHREIQFRIERKDGDIRWIEHVCQHVRETQSGRSGFRASNRDITARKQAEIALAKAHDELEKRVEERTAELKKLSETVEQSPVTVVITDKNGTIEYVNPTFCEITGYSAKETIGQNPRILKSGENPESFYKDLWDTILSGRTWRGELLNRKKNDEEFWESASISPIKNDDGEITHFVAVKEDITAKKQMEEELIQSKRAADEANKAKGDFVANMSHEIRTPMNAVIGMTHLALKTELTLKQRDYLNKIESSANSLLGIINDILDFSKIEAGKLDIESVEFNLDNVLDNLANLVTVKAREKEDLEVLFNTAWEVPRFLVGDPLRLGQILINLANNAVKFTESGEIIVSTELASQDEDHVTLKFSVSDTGIGLNEEQIAKLFQAFSQADTSTTRKFGGTGLGLTISKRLTEMMGGKIWVESESGQGSTFSFTASFFLGKEKAKERFVPSPDLHGINVLVVDDNASSRQILEKILESFSFEVTLTASGEEGLAELESTAKDQPYDLVIMDWKMPGMDGIEASKQIKHHKDLGNIPPIILVTAYGHEEIMQQAEQLGLEGFLLKPVSQSVLFDAVIQAMGHEVRKVSHVDRKKEDRAEDLKAICGARVLLVEDNEINQQVAKEILESAGLNVSLAENGQVGVSAVKENNYDAVLMDIQMPVMNGYEATREIRKDERFKDLPIIAMTAHAMAGDEDKSLQSGMNGHITKPIDPDQMFATLQKWIQPSEKRAITQKPVVSVEPSGEDKVVSIEAELPESLPGFDLADGLKRLQGNKTLYRKLLLNFATDYDEVANEIREALDAKDFDRAHSLVHNLKGLAGNLAATELQAAAVNIEKLVKGVGKKTPQAKELQLKFSKLENALIHALESVQTLGVSAEDITCKISDDEISAIPSELAQDIAIRIRDAAEMGDVMTLTAMAEELKTNSDTCEPLSKRIVKLAEDFEFDGILKLADELDAR